MMDREKIEQLLAAYINGELSGNDKQELERLFEQDPALKAEAADTAAMWQGLDGLEKAADPPRDMQKQFYELLDDESTQAAAAKVVKLKHRWLQVAAALFAGVVIFFAGRFTVQPVKLPVVKYQTVYIKQPGANTIAVSKPPVATALPVSRVKVPAMSKTPLAHIIDAEIEKQLRSIYTSERIDAIAKISMKNELSDSDLKQLGIALKEDPSPNVRMMIVDALRPSISKQNVQAVLIGALNRQDDGMIKTAMVDMLIGAHSPQALPQMIAMLNDKDTDPITQNKIKVNIESFIK